MYRCKLEKCCDQNQTQTVCKGQLSEVNQLAFSSVNLCLCVSGCLKQKAGNAVHLVVKKNSCDLELRDASSALDVVQLAFTGEDV